MPTMLCGGGASVNSVKVGMGSSEFLLERKELALWSASDAEPSVQILFSYHLSDCGQAGTFGLINFLIFKIR